MKPKIAVLMLSLLCCGVALAEEISDPSGFKLRSDPTRHEGMLPNGTASTEFNLVSVLAEQFQTTHDTGEVNVRFYIPKGTGQTAVAVEVSKIDRSPNYIMDADVQGFPNGIVPAECNTFHWPSSTVLDPSNIQPTELGSLVTIAPADTSEHVQPSVIYSSGPSDVFSDGHNVSDYVFTARTNLESHLRLNVYDLSVLDKPIFTSERQLVKPDTPTPFTWPCNSAPPGWYRAEIVGSTTAGEFLDMYITFYHYPGLTRLN